MALEYSPVDSHLLHSGTMDADVPCSCSNTQILVGLPGLCPVSPVVSTCTELDTAFFFGSARLRLCFHSTGTAQPKARTGQDSYQLRTGGGFQIPGFPFLIGLFKPY